MAFPTLDPLLSDLPPHAVAPASPSSTSVSDGSGPDDFDDQIFAGGPAYGPSGQLLAAPSWRGGQQASLEWKQKARENRRRGRGGVYEDDLDLDDDEPMEAPGVGGDKLPYEIWMNVSPRSRSLLERVRSDGESIHGTVG